MRKETADMLKTETHVYDQFFFYGNLGVKS